MLQVAKENSITSLFFNRLRTGSHKLSSWICPGYTLHMYYRVFSHPQHCVDVWGQENSLLQRTVRSVIGCQCTLASPLDVSSTSLHLSLMTTKYPRLSSVLERKAKSSHLRTDGIRQTKEKRDMCLLILQCSLFYLLKILIFHFKIKHTINII